MLRVNEDDVLTYYDQAGTKIGWEPVPDYMRTWREWRAPLLSGGAQDGPSQPGPRQADLTAIMRELHHYGAMMTEVAKVYDELTGGRISKPNTAAFHVLDASARREDEHIVHVLDLLAGRLEEAGHAAAARIARNRREDYGGEPDTTIPDSGIVFRELRREVRSGAQFRPLLADPPRWSPGTGSYCDDTLVIISGTSPVQVVCRAADLPGGGEDPQRRDQVLLVLGELCRDRGWIADVADVGDQIITIVSDQHAAAAATVVTETLRAAGLGAVTLHDDADAAAGLDGIHVIVGTWPVAAAHRSRRAGRGGPGQMAGQARRLARRTVRRRLGRRDPRRPGRLGQTDPKKCRNETPSAPAEGQSRKQAATTPAGCPEPFARTRYGVTMWRVPGRPGYCLTWGGESDRRREHRPACHAGVRPVHDDGRSAGGHHRLAGW